MYHAYPRECLFPHVSGTTNPLTQQEFADQSGEEVIEASEDVMKLHASQVHVMSDEPEALPWTFEEELVAENKQQRRQTRSSAFSMVHSVMAVAALASFAVPLIRAAVVLF